jgi:GNAT superfamily N-acetyltransferase
MAARSAIRDAAFLNVWVLPERRRRGVGSVLLAALAGAAAREQGATVLRARARAGETAALGFLARHGFSEVTREIESRLDLAGDLPPGSGPPAGVEIVGLANRPDLAPDAHALSIEAFADVPGLGGTVAVAFDEWRRENVDEALTDGSFLALALAGGRVVGSVGLTVRPGEPEAVEHLLTAVSRPWRRRGVARALKSAQIAWARGAGYRELVTYNDGANAAMLRLNERLGYRPRVVEITFDRAAEGAGS